MHFDGLDLCARIVINNGQAVGKIVAKERAAADRRAISGGHVRFGAADADARVRFARKRGGQVQVVDFWLAENVSEVLVSK